jgi:protein O-GlcNAc transferase
MNIEKTVQSAFTLFSSGNLKQAEYLCHEILKTQQDNMQALYLLGLIYYQAANYDLSITYFQKVIHLDPENAGTYINLGNAFHERGFSDKAICSYQKALEINPRLPDAYINLVTTLVGSSRYDEALTYCRKALEFVPHSAELFDIMGSACQGKGQLNEAISYFKKALRKKPDSASTYNNLGIALHHSGWFSEAIAAYQQALKLNPNLNTVYINLGNALQEQGQFAEAISSYQKVLQGNPSSREALNNLGNIFKDMGLLDDAESYYRRAAQADKKDATSCQNLLLIMHYNPRYDAQTIFHEHLQFAKQYTEPLAPLILPLTNKRIPARRLKIGYISPDFRKQSVGFFIEPVLESHHHDRCEIICYANLPSYDEASERMKGYADHWRDIAGVSDEKAAELIRSDEIDILVDLAGHTAFNRMLVFARKPAPIQITWIGYPNTTGLSSMDYKIVDNFSDPPGMTDRFYTETLLRMPDCFLCYRPYHDCPLVRRLPVLSNRHVTFGSFNTYPKISSHTFGLWIAILKATPHSRIIIKAKSLADTGTREHAMSFFTQAGIAQERIELLPWQSSANAHLETYNRIDIGLDTFPYAGTTTTCEALWMGVPVVTLAGTTHASRVGVSLLSNISLGELVAQTPDAYVRTAVALASDMQKLRYLRENLRKMMATSPLTDAKKFVTHLEDCYRSIWEKWCKTI